MKNDLKLLVLVPAFGVAGAAATVAMWYLFIFTLGAFTPPSHVVLGCIVSGLIGPVAVACVVWSVTRDASNLRWPASIGLGMVFATELAFYLPLGFMAVAFHGT